MEISVSVIMPSLNVGQYIEECIQSVIKQTLRNIEIICIDAGSIDGTLEIIRKYANADERIKLIHSDVKSYGYQVNIGIQMARGEYIAILETDDFVAEDMYEKLYSKAKSNDLDVSRADFYYLYHDCKDLLAESHVGDLADITYNKVFLQSEAYESVPMDSGLWKGIYRREFLIQNSIALNDTPGAAYQDIGFLMQVAYANPRIMFIPDSLYYYRYERDDSSSCSKDVLKYVYQEYLYLKDRGILSNNDGIAKYICARLLICFAFEYDKLAKKLDFNVDSENVRLYYNCFKNFFYEVAGTFPDIEQLLDYKRLTDIFENEDEYLTKKQISIDRKKGIIEQIVREESILIFGCGLYGKRALRILLDNNFGRAMFCDNNESLWGTSVAGCPVYKPEDVLSRYKGPIIIACKDNYQVIMEQIRGYSADNVLVNAESLF